MINQVNSTILRNLQPTTDILYMPYNGYSDYLFDFGQTPYYNDGESVYEIKNGLKAPFLNNRGMNDAGFFSCLIYNDVDEQSVLASKYTRNLHLPSLLIQHNLPSYEMPKEDAQTMFWNRLIHCCKVIVPDSLISRKWGITCAVVPYYVPTFEEEKTIDVCLVGDIGPFDEEIINTVRDKIKGVVVDGHKDFFQTLDLLKKSKVCICPNGHISPQTLLLMAMGCGCSIITNKTPLSEKWIKHSTTGILVDNFDECALWAQDLLNDHTLLGNPAREYVKDHHNIDLHRLLFNKALGEVRNSTWIL